MRQPQYTMDRAYRIISLPGGWWELQWKGDLIGKKTIDPWEKRSHAVAFDEAMAMLRSHQPKGRGK